jgi:hypothetical protein
VARVANLIGFAVAKGTWATAEATIGPGDTHRLFYPGQLPTTFDGDGTPSNITCIVSYKTMNTNVAAYVNSIPANRNVVMDYHVEPENDYTLGSTFVAEFKTQSDLIRAQGRSNVRVALISMTYPYRNGGPADVLAGNYLRGLGPYVDVFSCDVYQGSGGTSGGAWPSNGLANYDRWLTWLSLVTNPAVVGTVKPLAITEYGVDDPVGNTARNTRIALDRDYLLAAFTPGGASAVSAFGLQWWEYWWQDKPPPDPNQSQFTDAATIATWQAIETASAGGGASAPYLIGSATLGSNVSTALVIPVATPSAAGDTITVSTAGSGGACSSVADSKGNTYSQRNSDTGGVGTLLNQFTADATTALTASDTITCTWVSLASSKQAAAAGISGLAASPLDLAPNADNAGSTAPSVTSGALATTGEVAFASQGNASTGGAITWAAGWTQLYSAQTPNSGPWVSVAYQMGMGTAAVTASGTIVSAKWTMELLTFKPVGTIVNPGVLVSELDIGLDPVTKLVTPAVNLPAAPAVPAAGYPQIFIEAGFTTAAPVSAPGTFVLGGPVTGKLDTGLLGDTTTWTDITAFLRQGTITRPSTRVQGPLLTYQAGTGSMVLDNSDGRFDPDNLAGPYVIAGASQVGAMVPLRVRATFAGTGYQVFYGFADAWQDAGTDYDEGYSEVTVTGTDGFKVLAGVTLADTSATSGPVGAGETSGARVTRILDAASWFTDHRQIATGDSAMQGTTFGTDALSLLQLTADSETGELYIDGAGNVVFRNRHAILTDTRSTVPQGVFGDLAPGGYTASYTGGYSGPELAYASVGRANDDTTLANDVQITIAGGSNAAEAASPASIRKNLFPRTYSRTGILLQSDAEALSYAQWVLVVSLAAEDRFETLTIDPLADPANLFPQVLGREIGDRIQIWRRPQNSGQVITRDCFIRGITHTVDAVAGTWQTVWTLQDATKYAGFLILDSASLGKLGTGALAF